MVKSTMTGTGRGVEELSSSQDTYGHHWVTLTFDPVTFLMPSMSCGPEND